MRSAPSASRRPPRAHRCALGLALTVSASVVLSPARASSTATNSCLATLELEALPARSCPVVFGDAAAREGNQAHREQVLETIEVGEYAIDLVHRSTWEQPAPVSYDSLTLRGVVRAPGCAPIALVALDAEGLAVDCAAGLYAVQVDDSLGHSAQILAVLDDVVLVETAEQLRYLQAGGHEQPVWRLTWQSPWRYKVPQSSGGSGGAGAKQPGKPAAKPAKKAPPKKTKR